MPHDQHLALFAKYWEPGAVKTRLAGGIGVEAAASLQREFLVTLVGRLSDVGERREIVFAPRDRERAFRELAGAAWELAAQRDGDLGARLAAFFHQRLTTPTRGGGMTRVVVIGADSPTLPRSYVEEAFRRLDSMPVVLGPTEDGGYYLVGARGAVPPIFAGIDWSTPRVWGQTVERLQAAGIPFAELPPWYDVDELSDLHRLQAELAALARAEPGWRPLWDAVASAISPEGPCTTV